MSEYSLVTYGVDVETWETDETLPDSIRNTIDEVNQLGYEGLMQRMPKIMTGDYQIDHALIAPKGSSTKKLFVQCNPFGNAVTDDKLIRAEFYRRSAEKEGFTDDEGDPLGILVLGSPGWGTTIELSKAERKIVAGGDFAPIVKKQLEVIRSIELGRLTTGEVLNPEAVGFTAHSQGSEFVVDSIANAGEKGLGVIGAAIGDLVTAKTIPVLTKGRQFLGEGNKIRPTVEGAGVEPFMVAQGWGENPDILVQVKNILKMVSSAKPVNIALIRGLSRGTLDSRLVKAFEAEPDILLNVAVGEGLITNTKEQLGILTKHEQVKPVLLRDESHTWGDNVPKAAKFALRAFQNN